MIPFNKTFGKGTASRNLTALISKVLVNRRGQGRNTFYELSSENRTKIGRKEKT